MMKNKIIGLTFILVLVIALTGCAVAPAQSGQNSDKIVVELGENISTANKLTVSATGSIKVMPDVAYITVGVKTQNKDMKKAQQDNKAKMNQLFDAMKKQGLTEDDMRTTNYSAYPMYDYKNGKNTITGYEVTNMVEITIKDIDSVGEFLDIAADSGANTSYPIDFSLLDQSEHYNEALKDAVTQAKTKAETIATAGGYQIVGTLEITEGSYGYYPDRKYFAMDDAEAEDAATPITAGELEVTANITVIFEIQ